MLDQSNNLNYYFLVAFLFQIYICSKILKSLLYIFLKFDIIIVVSIAATAGTGGLASGSLTALDVIYISDIIHFFDHDKSCFFYFTVNQWQTGNLQKLLKYSKGTTTSVSNELLSFDALPIVFALSSKDLLVIFFIVVYLIVISIIFICIIISFISIMIPQTS